MSSQPKLPILSWRDVIKALSKVGFQAVRQRGSHVVLEADDRSLTVPRHDEIRRGTLLRIIEEAGLTKEEFLKLLD
ncbi:MAG: type II toxin-antitoxin system HicA family toxin [Candidatus Bathyarchaeia archaeon]